MDLLAEREHYMVYGEYENVMMIIKASQKKILIGDFYGNPQGAVIAEDETYCIMWGCGVIIYYLTEPFKEYEYNIQTTQWKEWGRNEVDVWIEDIESIHDETVALMTEQGECVTINVHNHNFSYQK